MPAIRPAMANGMMGTDNSPTGQGGLKMSNKYPGKCTCGKYVKAFEGSLYKNERRWVIQCGQCSDKNDHSSYEDRQCGDMAYEDRCAEQCGY